MEINDIWQANNKLFDFGIEGYNIPEKHIDAKRQIKQRQWEALENSVLKGGRYPRIRKYDSEGKEIIPTKKSFIDEIENKAKKLIKEVDEEKYSKFYPPLEKQNYHKKIKYDLKGFNVSSLKTEIYKHDRKTYVTDIINQYKKEAELSPERKELIDKTIEKHSKAIPLDSKLKNKGNLTRSDRVTVVSEQMYYGEKSAFYLPDKDRPFNPQKKYHSPKWSYSKLKVVEKQEPIIDERAESVKQKWQGFNIKMPFDVNVSFNLVKSHGKILNKLYKEGVLSNELQQIKQEKDEISSKLSPVTYFKIPKEKYLLNGKKKIIKNFDENYSDREQIEKKISKRNKTFLF